MIQGAGDRTLDGDEADFWIVEKSHAPLLMQNHFQVTRVDAGWEVLPFKQLISQAAQVIEIMQIPTVGEFALQVGGAFAGAFADQLDPSVQ